LYHHQIFNMRSTVIASIFALGAVAAPIRAPMDDSIIIEARQFGFGGSATSNDLVNSGCKPITYIFARGTTENGNMGSTVGPAFAATLKSAFGQSNVAVQGVDYPANVNGAIQGSINPKGAQGAKKMASLAQQAASKCPDSKVVLAGYSQGAQQVHGALMNLGGSKNIAVRTVPCMNISIQGTDDSSSIGRSHFW
jgi:cutinase